MLMKTETTFILYVSTCDHTFKFFSLGQNCADYTIEHCVSSLVSACLYVQRTVIWSIFLFSFLRSSALCSTAFALLFFSFFLILVATDTHVAHSSRYHDRAFFFFMTSFSDFSIDCNSKLKV